MRAEHENAGGVKMKVTALIENTQGEPGCISEHGLSLYVETEKHTLLMDTGKSGALIPNAKILGVDLSKVEAVFLSHGHYDHTGGLLAFEQINSTAPVYMQSSGTGEFYDHDEQRTKYIGIDPEILELSNLDLIDGDSCFDDDIEVFTNVKGRRYAAKGNAILKEKVHGEFRQDRFRHEQYLVISEGKKRVLFSGCAHAGIVNILDRFRDLYGDDPDFCISGFHMMQQAYTQQDLANIRAVGKELAALKTCFWTGHCTGERAYRELKKIMGNKLHYLHCGDTIIF